MEKFVKFSKHELVGVLHSTCQKTSACVITCHGLFSSKEGEKYIEIASRFCGEGFSVFRFDFMGCGESVGGFGDSILKGRIEDLGDALDFVQEEHENIGVMGSSLGGCVSILRAAKDKRIKALATWATPCHGGELFESFHKLRRDLLGHDVAKAVKEVDCPILIVHGSSDEIVPVFDAEILYENANKPKSITIIEGADHTFSEPIHRKKVIDVTLDWFKYHLR